VILLYVLDRVVRAVAALRVRSRRSNLGRRMICRAEESSVSKVEGRVSDSLTTYFTSAATVKYLDGTLPGDRGFDPLGLMDPAVGDVGVINQSWLKYSEVIHCRFAMLGAAGCIAPEALAAWGLTPSETGMPWFASGLIPPLGVYDGYWTDPWSLFLIEIVLIQFAELKRLQDFRHPGSQAKQYFLGIESAFAGSGDPAYPGGPWFNLFNFGRTPEEMLKFKRSEIENGRLAMIAVFGYGAQAVLTGKGPYENLVSHLSDPVNNNMLANFFPH